MTRKRRRVIRAEERPFPGKLTHHFNGDDSSSRFVVPDDHIGVGQSLQSAQDATSAHPEDPPEIAECDRAPSAKGERPGRKEHERRISADLADEEEECSEVDADQ